MTHLRQAMLEELQRCNFAETTITSYLKAVEQFTRYFKRPPDRLTHTHRRTYQAYLLRERKLLSRTVRLHVAALRFFFVKTLKRRCLLDDTPYPKVPRRLPQVLSVEEVTRLIEAAQSLSHRTMLMLLYSTGMRNAELRHLHVRDINCRRMLIHIQQGKGGHDRYVPLSATLLATLRAYYRWMQPTTYLSTHEIPCQLHDNLGSIPPIEICACCERKQKRPVRHASQYWSRDGSQLFYVAAGQQLVVVSVTVQPTFTFGNPVSVSGGGLRFFGGLIVPRRFDIGPDGGIIGVVDAVPEPSAATVVQRIEVVLNWFEELKARVPTK